LNGACQFLVYAEDVNIVSGNRNTVRKKRGAPLEAKVIL